MLTELSFLAKLAFLSYTVCCILIQIVLVKPQCKRYMSSLLNSHVSGYSSSDNYHRVWFHWYDQVEASVRMYVITPLICVCWALKLRWGRVAPLPLTSPLSICCPELIYPSMVLVNPLYIYTVVSQSPSDGIGGGEGLLRDSHSPVCHWEWILWGALAASCHRGETEIKWGSCDSMWISLVRLLGVLETCSSYELISLCKQLYFTIYF